MKADRLERMESSLKKIIGTALNELLQEKMSDFGLITINEIKLASDLSYLDIFVSSLRNPEKLCKDLAHHAQVVKEHINREMTLRKTPIIRFRYDETLEKTTQLISKINEITHEHEWNNP